MTIKAGYIRVSEILSQWDRFGCIKPEVLERNAKLGTEIHEAIDAHSNGFSMPISKGHGYLESYFKWSEATNFELISYSQRFYCDKLNITGEVDAIIKMPGDKDPIIVDFKTSAATDDLFWKLQGQFYHYLCESNSVEIGQRFLFVKLDKEGGMPTIREYKSSSVLMNVCMSAYICYRYLNKLDQKSSIRQ